MSTFQKFTCAIVGGSRTLTLPATEKTLIELLTDAEAEFVMDKRTKLVRLAFQGDTSAEIGAFESDGTTPIIGDSARLFGGDVTVMTKPEFSKTKLLKNGTAIKFRMTQYKKENLQPYQDHYLESFLESFFHNRLI